jgi:hypothetical protein
LLLGSANVSNDWAVREIGNQIDLLVRIQWSSLSLVKCDAVTIGVPPDPRPDRGLVDRVKASVELAKAFWVNKDAVNNVEDTIWRWVRLKVDRQLSR